MELLMEYGLELALAIINGIFVVVIASIRRQRNKEREAHEREMRNKEARLETIENKQIRIQSEADAQKAQMEIFKDMIADIPKSRETWQAVIDRMSARRKDESDRLTEVLDKLDVSVDNNTQSILNLSSVLEIQSEKYIKIADNIHRTETASQASKEASEQALRVVTEKSQHIEKLIADLKKELADIRETQETHITSAGERHTEAAIKFARITEKLGSIEVELGEIRGYLNPPTPPKPPNEIDLPAQDETDTNAA